jgi:hypothetical protein
VKCDGTSVFGPVGILGPVLGLFICVPPRSPPLRDTIVPVPHPPGSFFVLLGWVQQLKVVGGSPSPQNWAKRAFVRY